MKYFLYYFLLPLLFQCLNCMFFTKIFYQINKEKIGENLIISPLSIYQLLSLLSNGAKGETISEMIKALGSSNIEELNDINRKILEQSKLFSNIEIANAIMTKCKPLNSFLMYAKLYLADVEILESVEQINNWCSEKTHGKINQIIEELNPQTKMILLNAVYFKGNWVFPFDKDSNMKLPFYNLGKEKILVETMVGIENYRYFENPEFQIIELPFKEDFMSAIIILPSENSDINLYIESLLSKDQSKLYQLIQKLDYARVQIELPKFEINFSQVLNNDLKKLGIKQIFECEKGDLSGLCEEEKNIWVSSIIHKTYLKINESGTEAASVTAAIALGMAINYNKEIIIYKMKVNRPFLFILKNSRFPQGYDIVFMGKIEKILD